MLLHLPAKGLGRIRIAPVAPMPEPVHVARLYEAPTISSRRFPMWPVRAT